MERFERGDYSVRAVPKGHDEIALHGHAFNCECGGEHRAFAAAPEDELGEDAGGAAEVGAL